MFSRLFGKKKPSPPPRDLSALLRPYVVPALHLCRSDRPTRSFFGGTPTLPEDVTWPTRNGSPLDFLGCIFLEELHRTQPVDWLPASGSLLFFYDIDDQPWGYDPEHRSGWCVMHLPGLVNSEPERDDERKSNGDNTLPLTRVAFHKMDSYPMFERPCVEALNLTDKETDNLGELSDQQYGENPHHQMIGFPTPIQGDSMELECEMASNGLSDGDLSGYEDPRVKALEATAHEWKLLLQFDSDDDLGVMWGDCGMLYFWIREEDAKAGRFDKTWLALQCC